jgi:membrane fusion protein (multidrug efflux system)
LPCSSRFGFVTLATFRWNAWVGGAPIQTTNDAYIRADTDAPE